MLAAGYLEKREVPGPDRGLCFLGKPGGGRREAVWPDLHREGAAALKIAKIGRKRLSPLQSVKVWTLSKTGFFEPPGA
jgi:hypothetical protein